MASHPNTKSVTFILQSMRPLHFCILSDEQIRKRGYLLIQSSVSYVISNARECRRMYVSIDIYLLAHSFFEQRTVQLLNLWSESIFANSTHWLVMTHAPGFRSKQTIWRKKIWQLAVYCQIYKCHDFMPPFLRKKRMLCILAFVGT